MLQGKSFHPSWLAIHIFKSWESNKFFYSQKKDEKPFPKYGTRVLELLPQFSPVCTYSSAAFETVLRYCQLKAAKSMMQDK